MIGMLESVRKGRGMPFLRRGMAVDGKRGVVTGGNTAMTIQVRFEGQWRSSGGTVVERLWAAERVTFPRVDFLLSLSAMPLEPQGSSCWSVALVLLVGAFSRGIPAMKWAHVGLLALCHRGSASHGGFLFISTHYEQ